MISKKVILKDEIVIKKISLFLLHLDIKFKDISNYILAFVHKSIVNERNDYASIDNERLEFLGDAVLELIITESLYKDFPNNTEGYLTDLRSAIVRGRNLAEVGKNIGLQNYLFLGKGEELSGGRENDYIIANCVESFLGAIYLDLGYREAKKFVLSYIYKTLDPILQKNLTKDYKTLIQEYSQANFDITPSYNLLSETGPDHDKVYEVGVVLGNKIVGVGFGSSKKKAQENSAKIGFENMKKDTFSL